MYATDLDANDKLINYRRMLTGKEIYEARPSVWSKRDVLERSGTPKEPIQHCPLMKRGAWSYRMYVTGTQQAHFDVLFNDDGVFNCTMIVVNPFGGDHHSRK